MHLRTLLLTVCAGLSLYSQAQSPAIHKYYFRSPVGAAMELSANFGELRNDHWHMGLDVRTNAKENQPIYAAAEGYIASIGVRPG
ncbi:MAG: M23 family peptidase, partial [Bacteroidota bacterium]